MLKEDTIAAVSTSYGTGGIGIIRISGDKAFEVAGRLFHGKKPFEALKSHTMNYGKIVDPSKEEIIDEVLLCKMKKPNSYTKEDIVEINCHGGSLVIKRILEAVIQEGARPAEPGEFTKRAFLNGRIDLSQAEAVIDLISAKTKEGSKAALSQLEGKLSRTLQEIRSRLVELIAHIEVTVDYPEDDIEEITGQKVHEDMLKTEFELESLVNSFERGRMLRDGLNVVIVGRPNVGKSSLLNELTGKNKAIVTDIPGTTRDIIEEYITIRDIPIRIVDTAGLRETSDIVEKIGVEKAKDEIEKADLVMFVLDAAEKISEQDLWIYESVKEKKILVLLNKVDIAEEAEVFEHFKDVTVIKTSAQSGLGIEEIENEIYRRFIKGDITLNNEVIVTNTRHKSLIQTALKSIREAIAAYDGAMPLDCITIDIRNAAEALGQITGESINEEVMHQIFSRFCIGK